MKSLRQIPSILTGILLCLFCSLPFFSTPVVGQPFCEVRSYDEFDGLSQRLVKQVVQSPDGMLWFATWNGLNRYDGYTFAKIHPAADDVARRYSERFGDLKLNASGNLWCRVDQRILEFDLKSYRFSDLSASIEAALGRRIEVSNLSTTAEGETVLECADGTYITLTDTLRDAPLRLSSERPPLHYLTPGNRRIHNLHDYTYRELIYAHEQADGSRWIITTHGAVCYAPSAEAPWQLVTQLDAPESTLYYGTTDRSGNVWLRSTVGVFCLTLGTLPYTSYTPRLPSRVRSLHHDPAGRLWLSESDANLLACFDASDTALTTPRYLTPEGRWTEHPVSFGHAAYTFASQSDSSLWVGTKPDGLFRLRPRGDGYEVQQLLPAADPHTLSGEAIYDLRFDGYGRLWIATLGGGIDCIEHPEAETPIVTRLGALPTYPDAALRVRHIELVGDSLLMAATTGGLLVAALPACGALHTFTPRLEVSDPDRAESLGNVAVMDVLTDRQGRTYVATESDGVNVLLHRPTLSDTPWRFGHLSTKGQPLPDVALSLALDAAEDHLWVVSNNTIYDVELSSGVVHTWGASFWHKKQRFCDARPLPLTAHRQLVGTEEGALFLEGGGVPAAAQSLPLYFTSVSIQNRPDSLLAPACDTLLLASDERNITLHFAALDFAHTDGLTYASSLDGVHWSELGAFPTMTMLDLKAGTHQLWVRSTDRSGAPADNVRCLTIVVTPTFMETSLARFLLLLLILALCIGAYLQIRYVLGIKRQQRETMEAYLRLLNAPIAPAKDVTPSADLSASAATSQSAESVAATGQKRPLSPTDELFMQQVAEFIQQQMSNAEVNIDDLATATASSRSGLNRKMRSLFGMTPAEFIKESRLSRAATLMSSTDRPVSEIAWECGFDDLNYFGKCFKARFEQTPTAYRKNQSL